MFIFTELLKHPKNKIAHENECKRTRGSGMT